MTNIPDCRLCKWRGDSVGAEGVEAAARVFTMCHINRSTDGVAPLYICAERSRWVFAETPHSVLNVFTSQTQTTSVCRMSPFGCEITKIPKTQSRCVQRAVRTIVGRLNSTKTCRRRAESCCWSLRLHTHHASISDVTGPHPLWHHWLGCRQIYLLFSLEKLPS